MSTRYEIHADIAAVTFDNPPVNGLSLHLRQDIVASLRRAYADPAVRAIVLIGAGRGFCAGGDLKEVGTPKVFTEPAIAAHILPLIESARKPVIAAIHGFAMGGGFEIALACHYRISTPDALIALPEVSVGLVPPSGSQRLPRLIGLEAALDLIVSAARVRADAFARTPLFDVLVDGDLPAAALEFARRVVDEQRPLKLVRHIAINHPDPEGFLQEARERVRAGPGPFPSALRAVDAIAAAALSKDFDTGMAIAKKIHDELQLSPETRALSAGFLAARSGK